MIRKYKEYSKIDENVKIIFNTSNVTIWEYKGYNYNLSVKSSKNGEYIGWSLHVINPDKSISDDERVIGCLSENVPGSKWEGDLVTNAIKLIKEFAG